MDFVTKVMTPIEFGPGVIEKTGEKASAFNSKKALLITDQYMVKSGVADKVLDSLDNFGIDFVVFDSVVPDPHSELIMEAAAAGKNENCDCVIGLGGGSSLDVAKMARLMMVAEGDILEYSDPQKFQPTNGPKLILIPTTSGTGSEVTIGAMVTDLKNERKRAISGQGVIPDIALVDPELALAMPPRLTAFTGFDAFAHAVEEYLSVFSNGMSDILSASAIRDSVRYLKKAVDDGSDIEARSFMSRAATIAGLAMNYCGLIAGHNMAHPLGAHYHIPHGVACAITLPWVVEFVAPTAEKKVRELVEMMGGDSTVEVNKLGETARELMIDFALSIGLPLLNTFENVKREDFEKLSADAHADLYGFLTPRTIGFDDYLAIYNKVFDYRR